MQKTFYPPREHPVALRLMGTLLPIICKLWRGIDGILIGDAQLARLRALGQERLLLCANHPTLGDPLVIFELGRRAGIAFNYMSARELFCFPFAWVLQRLGAYSVRRGAPDRESLRCTRRLLGEGNRQV